MTQDIRDFVTPSCDLLAFGEPTHLEPAFASLRNELLGHLAGVGFRSIVLEIDRAAALIVNDFVREGIGTLGTVMSEGFSTGFGAMDANRQLVTWMRHYNENRPPEEQLSFHGCDASMENMSAPSPRSFLEHARDYLKLDFDLSGDDNRWSRTEAILDPAMSIGDTPEAEKLRVIADDMLTSLYARAPELIAATSRAEWFRAKTHLTTGLGLLRYHRQSAQRIDETARISGLLATRDALMAQNLLDIRDIEARRGPTLVFAHNLHLQPNLSTMPVAGLQTSWFSAGAIVASLVGEQYTFIAGSLGRSGTLQLQDPEPDTYEGFLQREIPTWGLTPATSVPSASARTDPTPQQGYFPLSREILATADVILHVNDGPATTKRSQK